MAELFHVEQAAALQAGARALGLSLRPEQVERLLEQLRLLERWNQKHNLVGPGDPLLWIDRHTLDSLAAASALPSGAGLDIGSGAGFPGIPLAVARPDCRFTLIEPRRKRAAFLQAVIAALGLENAGVQGACAAAPEADFALSRATFPLADWLARSASLVRPGGAIVAFLGAQGLDAAAGAAAIELGLSAARLLCYRCGGQPPRTLALFVRGAKEEDAVPEHSIVPRGTAR